MRGSWSWRGTGNPHGNARLSVSVVCEIKELEGRFSSRCVADMFDVGSSTVLDIWRGKTWRSHEEVAEAGRAAGPRG